MKHQYFFNDATGANQISFALDVSGIQTLIGQLKQASHELGRIDDDVDLLFQDVYRNAGDVALAYEMTAVALEHLLNYMEDME